MARSIHDLQLLLGADEPDYDALTREGAALLPALAELAADRNEYVAANAASLAGMIGGDRAVAVLERAAQSASPLVRTAAASALARTDGPTAAGLLARLLNDQDKGVRKFAIKSSADKQNAALASKVADLSKRDPEPHLRALAGRATNPTRRA